ncbi:MAG: hypothetical protein AAF936_13940 [Pseudomonadota bacterium]
MALESVVGKDSDGRILEEAQSTGFADLREEVEEQAELLNLVDEDEIAHRRRAVGKHQGRYLGQVRSAFFVVILAVLAPSFWRIVFTSFGGDGASIGQLSRLEKPIVNFLMASHSFVQISIVYIFAALPVIALTGLILWTVWYRRERNHDWKVAKALADAREPEDSAKGFMEIFRLYARTKRRAIFIMLYSAVGFWWMSSCFLALFEGGEATLGMQNAAFGLPLIAAVIGVLSLACFYFAYDISRLFVPGKVLVRKTLIMSMLATTSQTDYTAARAAAHKLEQRLIHDRPWWFYSYRERPKSED